MRRGFTLLEVMVAVAILGLSLTVILSAQAGLYSGSSYAQHTSIAIGLARCRMSEIEERLLKIGFSIGDEKDDGPCCGDDDQQGMSCKWKIDRVKLPDPPGMSASSSSSASKSGTSPQLDQLLSMTKSGGSGLPGGGGLSGLGGALGMLSQFSTNPSSMSLSLGADGGTGSGMTTSSLAQTMSSGPAGGSGGLVQFAMIFVYPALRPMLEASIRKVTVTVEWKEGIRDRDLTIVQYITHPFKAGLLASPTGTSTTGTNTVLPTTGTTGTTGTTTGGVK